MKMEIGFIGLMVFFLIGSQGTKICKCNWLHYGGHCYKFKDNTAMTWIQAEDDCRGNGGYLVKVNNAAENRWLRKIAAELEGKTKARRHYWMGGSDAHQDGTWRWNIDFKPIRYTYWYPREPNGGRNEECLEMTSSNDNFKWNDAPCSRKYQHICESPAFHKKPCKCDA